MNLIEWRDEFRLGIPAVDHEHRELIELINALYASYTAGEAKLTTLDFLGELYARIAAHFALEEKIMQEQGYDQYQDHKADHEKLLDEICDFMDDFESGQEFPEGVFSKMMEVWFTAHFRDKDARLHRYLS